MRVPVQHLWGNRCSSSFQRKGIAAGATQYALCLVTCSHHACSLQGLSSQGSPGDAGKQVQSPGLSHPATFTSTRHRCSSPAGEGGQVGERVSAAKGFLQLLLITSGGQTGLGRAPAPPPAGEFLGFTRGQPPKTVAHFPVVLPTATLPLPRGPA